MAATRKKQRRQAPAKQPGLISRAWGAIAPASFGGAFLSVVKWVVFALVVLFLGYLVVSNTWMAGRLCDAKVAEEVERRAAIASDELKKAEERKAELQVQLERTRQSINDIRENSDAGQCINQRVPDAVIDAIKRVQ